MNARKGLRIVLLGNHGVPYSTENHYALTLEEMGHTVVRMQEQIVSGEEVETQAREADLLVVSHSHGWHTPGKPIHEVLTSIDTPSMSYHLDIWLGLKREKDLYEDPFYSTVDHFFATDGNMADWFNKRRSEGKGATQGYFLPAGVFDQECVRMDDPGGPKHDVIFVGSRGYHDEWPYRPVLIDWLKQTYGDRFAHYGGDGIGVVRGLPLNMLYGNSKVVVGDSLNIGFHYPNYWSDRASETLGRGGFLIHPFVEGMDNYYTDGVHLVFYQYGDFWQLKREIDFFLEHDSEREVIRQLGHKHVKQFHTYRNRWEYILEKLGL